jgi:biotin synthesis protein BioG
MNKNWISRNNRKNLILFFNGWGMDKSSINHLKSDNFDIIEFNDYSLIDFNENEYVNYESLYVVAWSLGVWVASFSLYNCSLPIKKVIAINGTLNPVSASEGIHPTIFKGTLTGWNEESRTRFLIRIIGGRKEYSKHVSKFGVRIPENQKAELVSLDRRINASKVKSIRFDTILIGNQDAIFSPENQKHYWIGKANCKYFDMPHYPFLQFSSWEEILMQ